MARKTLVFQAEDTRAVLTGRDGVGLDVCVCIWYNVYMETKEKPTLRASQETRQQLKVIAALTGETMQAALARLVKAEYDRVKQEK